MNENHWIKFNEFLIHRETIDLIIEDYESNKLKPIYEIIVICLYSFNGKKYTNTLCASLSTHTLRDNQIQNDLDRCDGNDLSNFYHTITNRYIDMNTIEVKELDGDLPINLQTIFTI